jgi:hypothetical protein
MVGVKHVGMSVVWCAFNTYLHCPRFKVYLHNPTDRRCRTTRVARWFFLRSKIPIWVYFGGPCNGKCWFMSIFYNLCPFVIIYVHLVLCMADWCSLCSFGIFFPFWHVWTKKNLATLCTTRRKKGSILFVCGHNDHYYLSDCVNTLLTGQLIHE